MAASGTASVKGWGLGGMGRFLLLRGRMARLRAPGKSGRPPWAAPARCHFHPGGTTEAARRHAMTEPWQYQIRITMTDALAELARDDPAEQSLRPLTEILERHDATMVSQLDAFEAYVAEAERQGPEGYPLYKWTKAVIEDPEK